MLGGDPLHHGRVPAPTARPVRRAAAEPEPRPAGARAGGFRSGAQPGADSAFPAGAAQPPSRAIRASTTPTSTVSSTATRISATTPAAGAGTSVSILSVEISHTVCSAATVSPTSTRQATTVPSATETPIWGMVTSTRFVSTRGAHGTPP